MLDAVSDCRRKMFINSIAFRTAGDWYFAGASTAGGINFTGNRHVTGASAPVCTERKGFVAPCMTLEQTGRGLQEVSVFRVAHA